MLTMTFYFKPPRGSIPLHKLEDCVHTRIQYLKFIETQHDISQSDNTAFKFEYLTDGSALDRTGHFMLRLISLKQTHMKDFLVKGETLLFEKRLRCLNASQVRSNLKTAVRHVREILGLGSVLIQYQLFLSDFEKVCSKMMLKNYVEHSFHYNHPENCNQLCIKVPFTLCLELVASRKVDLSNGFAIIPCGEWLQLLSCLYVEHLKRGLSQLYSSNTFKSAWFDDRVQAIARTLRSSFEKFPFPAKSTNDVACHNIDAKSVYFPPCMKNLHQTLRLRHRLTHNSRFYYSLFLKDIGMPLFESVEFWSNEYLQPHSACASCSHSWQRDGRKYTYSIRHMYGLEGSRREYHSHSCKQLQSLNLGPTAEGGCPFVHFDKKRLTSTLHESVTSDEELYGIILQVYKENPSQACHYYHEILAKVSEKSSFEKHQLNQSKHVFRTPAEFYTILASKFKPYDRN